MKGPQNEFALLISCKNEATKSWQYNGWMFYQSDVQFTGGALGGGVANLRAYRSHGSVAVGKSRPPLSYFPLDKMLICFTVVANTLMLKEASNIFFLQFVLKKRPQAVEQTIESWCDANKATATPFDDIKNLAIELEVSSTRNWAQNVFCKKPNFSRNCQ